MYHKYNTEGLVIRSRERGESSRGVTLFTEEFGIIHANVQNARGEKSKLKQGAQDFAYGSFTLLKGRHDWKVVGAHVRENFFYSLGSKQKYTLAAKILSLVTELVGEEKDIQLYSIILEFLYKLQSGAPNNIEFIERLWVLRILKNRGLVAEKEEDIESLATEKKLAISIINKALKAAHLS